MPVQFRSRLLAVIFLGIAACDLSSSYDVRGRVVGFGDDGRTIIVEHEAIPGLMPAMTMPFRSNEVETIARLTTGAAVGFTLHVSPDSTWIENVTLLPDDAVARNPAGVRHDLTQHGDSLLAIGDAVPSFTLRAQNGDVLRTDAFHGKAWLVTFIYTRCPLPDYCPFLSQQFARLQEPLRSRFGEDVRLLSVSIDPEYDTPEVLSAYARRYGAGDTWTFATGDPDEIRRMAHLFGVFYVSAGQEVTHNLTTTLVGPDGRVHAIWTGNDWAAEDVLEITARLLAES